MLLIAPDSFKGTFTAREVAEAIARGVPGEVEVCPVADGGEGTMEVVVAARGGRLWDVAVQDPLGRQVLARLGWVEDGATAIVEMATASGLALVGAEEREAEAASTYGTGELIATAVREGARRIVVTVGGSATTDGGAGAIAAIGAAGAAGGLAEAELVVACDVVTPFERAAELYGPQKGADAAAVARLAEKLDRFAAELPRDPRGVAMTGAAGGLSGGLWAAYGAALIPGAEWVLDAVDFDGRVRRADAVVTGEGRLDRQTFEGKLVGEVARRSARAGVPVHAVVGSCELEADEARTLGLASVQVASDEAAMAAAGAAVATDVRVSHR
jgi:glycerate kinase